MNSEKYSVEQSRSAEASIAKFFAWCGGAKADLVDEYPEERTRLATVGATVLFTGLFAIASSGYAIYSFFGPGLWVPVLAVLWGAAIFNIDRLIVMTMHGGLGSRLLAAIPRVALATVIAIAIARPLELWIFREEIQREIVEMEGGARKAADRELEQAVAAANAVYNAAAEAAGKAAGVDAGRAAHEAANARVSECQEKVREAAVSYQAEVDGTGGTMRRGYGPSARLRSKLYQDAQTRCGQIETAAETARQTVVAATKRQQELVQDQVRVRDDAIRVAQDNHGKKLAGLRATRIDSLLGRNSALARLSGRDSSVFWMSAVIMVLFWLIEVLPVTAKLMSGDTIYDRVVSDRRHAHRSASDGARTAAPEWIAAGKHAAELRVQTALREAEAAARAREAAIALHYQAIESTRKAVQDAWKVSDAAAAEGITALDEGARQSMRSAGNAALKGLAKAASDARVLKQAVVDGLTKSSLSRVGANLALPAVLIAVSVVVSYYAVALFSPFDKNALTIAVGIGALVASMAPSLLSRFSGTRAQEER